MIRATRVFGLLTVGLLATGTTGLTAPPEHAAADATFKEKVAPLLNKYCVSCHNANKPKADLNLAKYSDTASILASRKTWEQALDYIEGRDMPPDGKPKPSEAEIATMVGWLQTQLTSADCSKQNDPGRVTLRRLNRVEYNNTVKDLTGVDIRPADDFPSDDVGYGFDNIGDVLSLPPILFEKYMAAAEKIAETAIILDEPDRGKLVAYPAAQLPESAGGAKSGDSRVLATTGEVVANHEIKTAGEYYLIVKGYAEQAGNEPAAMEVRVDGKPIKTFQVTQLSDAPGRFEVRTRLEPGKHAIAAAFTNDFYDPEAKDPAHRDRNLFVERVEVQGPAELQVKLPNSHRQILFERKPGLSDEAYAAAVLEKFASRAFRRPATKDEVDRLVKIQGLAKKNGESFERGVQLALQAVLISPHFLFKIESDRKSKDGLPVPITDYELATRLSYFLWSSMPDFTLMDLAKEGKLKDDAALEAQVRRMMKSGRSRALVENFAGQWLQTQNLKAVSPDPKTFPEFDESLRAAMLKETEAYFKSIMDEDRSILEFLDSDYTFLNRRLARHYGVKDFNPPRPKNNADLMTRYTYKDGRRGGLISQASILTVTSNATRTSPVKRGKWILEQILNSPPPPPPPDVPELKTEGVDLKASLRTRMEQHRANPNCAVCHAKLDPLGFGLENFDGIGAWRDKDGEAPIDASGVLPGGKTFNGPGELRKILMGRSVDFTRGLVEKLMTYAVGRGLDYNDRCAVDRIAVAVEKDGHKFSRMVVEIVKSDSFRKRRPKGASQ